MEGVELLDAELGSQLVGDVVLDASQLTLDGADGGGGGVGQAAEEATDATTAGAGGSRCVATRRRRYEIMAKLRGVELERSDFDEHLLQE